MNYKMASVKRLRKEYEELIKNPPDNCSAGPKSEDNYYAWSAQIIGPADTPYAGGICSTLKLIIHQNIRSNHPKLTLKLRYITLILMI